MPLVPYIPPPVPDFVFMKKGASQMSCAGAAAATATMPFFQKFNKGGAFFLPFFLLTGGSVYFCVLTPPLTPSSLPTLWVFEFRSWRGGCSFCLLMDGGSRSPAPPFNHLIRLLCNPQGPSWAWQQSHGTAGHYRQTPWPKPPIIHKKKQSRLVQHHQERLQSLQQTSRAITMSGR